MKLRQVPAAIAMVVAATLVTVFADPAPARAYRVLSDQAGFEGYGRIRWATPIRFAIAPEQPAEVTDADAVTALSAAFSTWHPTCAQFPVENIGVGRTPALARDGIVTVQFIESADDWHTRGYADDLGAMTELEYDVTNGSAVIVDADIYVNAWAFVWGVEPTDPSIRDLQAVLTHEAGHALGLLHPCEVDGRDPSCIGVPRDTVMDPEYHGVSQRTLTSDDVAAVCDLYPAAPDCSAVNCGMSMLGDPCAAASDCATGLCGDLGSCAASCGAGCSDGAACDTSAPVPECRPPGGPYGSQCTRGSECEAGLCVLRDGVGSCTRDCSDAAPCPDDSECRPFADRTACVRRWRVSSGCSISAGPPAAARRTPTTMLALIGFGVVVVRVARRRRS
jgi:hypothetical protein